MKTINYELAKKLHDAGVEIESEQSYTTLPKYAMKKLVKEAQETRKFSAPNCEEVIEFLKEKIDWITYSKMVWFVIHFELKSITWPTLLKALEDTLEYLLSNWYIWTLDDIISLCKNVWKNV